MLNNPQLVNSGESIALRCTAIGPPTPTIEWYLGSMKLANLYNKISIRTTTQSSMRVSTLTVVNFVATDGGNYTCSAINTVGIRGVSHDIRLSK